MGMRHKERVLASLSAGRVGDIPFLDLYFLKYIMGH